LRSLRGSDNKIHGDFEMEMNLWSLESIALVALGRRLNCFRDDLPPDSPEKRLIKAVHDIFKLADELDFKPSLWRYFPTKTFKEAMKLYEDQDK
jgi:cytochrome P450 family 12